MYRLKLNAKQCIGCGICMDVCLPQAIAMRINGSNRIEGEILTYLGLHGTHGAEQLPRELMTFPFLFRPDRCDGCGLCVKECPVLALGLSGEADLALQEMPEAERHMGRATFSFTGQDQGRP
jgi:ferredoxin